jgi:hypothetical protein
LDMEGKHIVRRILGAAVLVLGGTAAIIAVLVWSRTSGPRPCRPASVAGSEAPIGRPETNLDEFFGPEFPAVEVQGAGVVEKSHGGESARVLRTQGLAMVCRAGQQRWRVAVRGSEIARGDAVRIGTSPAAARLLGPDGTVISLAAGG